MRFRHCTSRPLFVPPPFLIEKEERKPIVYVRWTIADFDWMRIIEYQVKSGTTTAATRIQWQRYIYGFGNSLTDPTVYSIQRRLLGGFRGIKTGTGAIERHKIL